MTCLRNIVAIGTQTLLVWATVSSACVASAENVTASRGSAAAALERYRENNATLQRGNEQLRQRIEAADRRAAELTERLAAVERERDALRAASAQQTERDAACEARVAAVRNVAEEAIARYESQGIWDILWREEPLTGIGKARVENAADVLRDRLATQSSASTLASDGGTTTPPTTEPASTVPPAPKDTASP